MAGNSPIVESLPSAPTIGSPSRASYPAAFKILAALAAACALLPGVYLVIRASGVEAEAWTIFWRARTLGILINSLALAVAVAGCSALLGTPLAWLLTRTDLPGRRIWTVLACLPLAVPSYVAAFVWISALGPGGLAAAALGPWTASVLPSIYGFTGSWVLLSLLTYPYVFLSVRGALLRMDPALEEASGTLGRNRRQTFFRIVLPLLRPAIGAGALLAALYALSDFGAVSLLRFESFTWAVYSQYRGAFDRSMAALLALMLVALTLGLLWGESRLRKRPAFSPSAHRKRAPVELGAWRWPALALCSLLVLTALGLPLAVISYWLSLGALSQWSPGEFAAATWNSLLASSLGAAATVVLAVPVAVVAVRGRGRLERAVERLAYLGYGLPGIVVGLALVFFGARHAPFLYQTLMLLIFAYVVRFLPQAVATTSASYRAVNPRVEEAALTLGRGRWRVFCSVTAPLIRPGALAGLALVFLTAVKELPMTLLLAPTGFETLATHIWSATSEAFFARAALPSLFLLLLSGVSVALILREKAERAL
ncbi:MAG TPA: iron ABC transporter permease [Acidobacteriota bacterium]|nr:iron ABC transporter permease [Acidobacteriota bacterium]